MSNKKLEHIKKADIKKRFNVSAQKQIRFQSLCEKGKVLGVFEDSIVWACRKRNRRSRGRLIAHRAYWRAINAATYCKARKEGGVR